MAGPHERNAGPYVPCMGRMFNTGAYVQCSAVCLVQGQVQIIEIGMKLSLFIPKKVHPQPLSSNIVFIQNNFHPKYINLENKCGGEEVREEINKTRSDKT